MNRHERRKYQAISGKGHYMPRLMTALGDLGPGLHHAVVLHDDGCAIFDGKDCNCEPDITLKGDQTDA